MFLIHSFIPTVFTTVENNNRTKQTKIFFQPFIPRLCSLFMPSDGLRLSFQGNNAIFHLEITEETLSREQKLKQNCLLFDTRIECENKIFRWMYSKGNHMKEASYRIHLIIYDNVSLLPDII